MYTHEEILEIIEEKNRYREYLEAIQTAIGIILDIDEDFVEKPRLVIEVPEEETQ